MPIVTCYVFVGEIWYERGWNGHRGQDMTARADKRILVPPLANGGTVTVSERMPDSAANSYGNWIEIKHTDGNYSRYAHMSTRYLNVGDIVSTAQVMGIEGSTGNSSGSHLHVEYLNSSKGTMNPHPLTGVPNNTAQGIYSNDYDPTIPPGPEPPGPGPTPIRNGGEFRKFEFYAYQLQHDETITTPFGAVQATKGDWIIQDDKGHAEWKGLHMPRKNVFFEVGEYSG